MLFIVLALSGCTGGGSKVSYKLTVSVDGNGTVGFLFTQSSSPTIVT